MATTVKSTVLTVQQLRDRWLLEKQRLAGTQDSYPTAVRFHRACSWLEGAQQLDADNHGAHMLIVQWTCFNALYGQWDMARHESLGDRESWQVFLTRMLDLDEAAELCPC